MFNHITATPMIKNRLGDRNLNIKRVIENIKTIIRLYAQRELDAIMEKMSNTYELPPLDMIG